MESIIRVPCNGHQGCGSAISTHPVHNLASFLYNEYGIFAKLRSHNTQTIFLVRIKMVAIEIPY
jgi:hypothetical protein